MSNPSGPTAAGRGPAAPLLLSGIALYMACFWVLCDDHWWHMLTGRLILATGHIPDADVFSFTYHGAPWTNWEWLAGVLMSLAWSAGGALGLVVLRAVALGGTMLVAVSHWRRRTGAFLEGGSELAALLVGSALLLVAQARTADRPHTYAFLLLAATHALASRLRERWSLASAAGLVALFVVWVNFHPSWMLGMGLCGAVFLDALRSSSGDRTTQKRLLEVGAAMAASVLLTPNLGRFFGSVSEIFGKKVSGEWDPVWKFLSLTHIPLMTFLLVAAVWAVSVVRGLQAREGRGAEIFQQLVLAVLLVLAFRHAMLTPVFTIAAVPYLRLDRLGWAAAGRGLTRRTEILASVLVAALVLALAQGGMGRRVTFGIGVDPHVNPVAQTDFLEAHHLGGRVYCTSKEAHGYVAFRLWPAATIYIDGRVPQVYPVSFLNHYIQTGEPEVLNADIDRYGIDHFVLVSGLFAPINVDVAEVLRQRGDFALVDFDENGALWSRTRHGAWPCPDCRPFEILNPYVLRMRDPGARLQDSPALRGELAHLEEIGRRSKLARELAQVIRNEAGLGPALR